jgi:predicted nucleic-acid-binding protein
MRAVDTNVLVRRVTRDDPKQVATADAFVQGGAVPDAVSVRTRYLPRWAIGT